MFTHPINLCQCISACVNLITLFTLHQPLLASGCLCQPVSHCQPMSVPVSYCPPLVAESSEEISDFNGITQKSFVKVNQRKLGKCEKFQECLL